MTLRGLLLMATVVAALAGGAVAAAVIVLLLSILDLTLKFPFGGYSMATDILFLTGAAIVLYMGFETYREL